MSTLSIVIASAASTAVGSFNGAFGNTPAHELGAGVIKSVLARAGVEAGEVNEVILGTVTAGNANGLNDGAAALLMTEAQASSAASSRSPKSCPGHRPDPDLAQGAGKGPAGRLAMSSSSTPSQLRPARSTRISAGILASSTSTAARSPSAIRSALSAFACLTRYSSK